LQRHPFKGRDQRLLKDRAESVAEGNAHQNPATIPKNRVMPSRTFLSNFTKTKIP